MMDSDLQDPSSSTGYSDPSSSSNWWEGPPPPGYKGTWPPALPPGAHYDPNTFGLVVSDDPTKPIGTTNAPPVTTPAPTPAPGGGVPSTPNGADTGTGLGSLFQPFGTNYTNPAPVNLGGPAGIPYIPQVPTYTPPTYTPPPAFSYADFQLPTTDDVYTDPSYLLREKEGQSGIESSAAGKGLVRSGGNLMDILKYNQGFASSEYGNIVDRKFNQYEANRGNALDAYKENYQTQYTDPYTFDTQAAKDAYAPQFAQWQVQGQAGQRQSELNSDQAWQAFLQQYRQFDDQRKFQYGVLSDQQRLGLDAATA